jgi:hypothetical protein
MNRRNFLKLGGGALVASATMAEAGMLAEFMSWLKRKPAWSFPSKPSYWVAVDPAFSYADLTDITIEYIVPAIADTVFSVSPIFERLRFRNEDLIDGGGLLRIPFRVQHEKNRSDAERSRFLGPCT